MSELQLPRVFTVRVRVRVRVKVRVGLKIRIRIRGRAKIPSMVNVIAADSEIGFQSQD
jgi:hypothetical protein